MKKINKILVIFFVLFFSNNVQSEKHNQVSVELDRIKNDIIDLQKFVYKNKSSLNNHDDSNTNNDLDELKKLINNISKNITSLEKQILDIKDDVSNLYSLYTSSDTDEKKIISTSDQLNIEESSSKVVENSQDDQLLGQISLSDLGKDEVIKTANDTIFGLAAGIWSKDITKAMKIADNIEAGTIYINNYFNAAAQSPVGGYKQSGYSREKGVDALKSYLQVKNVGISLG